MMNQMNQMPQMSQMSKEQLRHFIDVVSFQVMETQLYLDSHPTDEEAMKHFNYYMDLRNSALKTYAELYGPLTMDTANPTNYWTWVDTPWPWEGGSC